MDQPANPEAAKAGPPTASQPAAAWPCGECKKETTDLYWIEPVTQQRLEVPICANCYADAIRRWARELAE